MKKTIATLSLLLLVIVSFAQEIHKTTDKKGNFCLEKSSKIIVKERFENVASYNKKADLIPAKLNGKWGFYNNDGKLVIPHQYEGLMFQNVADLQGWYMQDRMQVVLNGKKFFIDKTGQEVEAPEYDVVVRATWEGAGYFFKKGGKWAFANEEKKVLTEFKYDRIIGPIGINPFVYRATRDGQDFRLDANGQEEAAIEGISSNSKSSSTNKDNSKDKCTYKCQKCDKTTQGKCNSSANGIAVENCFAQQPDPKGPRKNHEWRKQ